MNASDVSSADLDREDTHREGSVASELPAILAEQFAAVLALQRICDRHVGVARPALYGRRGAMELRCQECNKPSPCDTWRTANTALEVAR